MNCPYCYSEEGKVIDKRNTEEGKSIRRRRKCLSCNKRFTTYERIEDLQIYIVKKDGRKEVFSPEKLKLGLVLAFEKRPVTLEAIDNIVKDLQSKARSYKSPEIESKVLGRWVLVMLKKTDKIAYIRFASIYKEIENIEDLNEEMKTLIK